MVKAYNKNLRRMFKANILRLLAICMIVAIGISIVTGIGALPLKMRDSLSVADLPVERVHFLEALADKIEMLGVILPTFFIIVAALTALTTMIRLIEEERAVIACYRTLGYSVGSVVLRYAVFAFTCAVTGCVTGLIFGNFVLCPIVFDVIQNKFLLPDPGGIFLSQGLIWSVVMIAVIVITGVFVSLKRCLEKPAALLRPKPPRAGRKFFMEKIPFIWNSLKFKYKSTTRNIWRYKGRMITTVLSVSGSTVMLFVGLGLLSSLKGQDSDGVQDMAAFISSMSAISVVITLCAVSLSVLVLFNLTNINIEERKREIATLKVLGYSQIEVAGFIFRELLILSVIGIAIGLPSGYYFLGFIFDYIEFGSIDLVKWYIWVFTLIASVLSVLLADVLLYRKISKIEMHKSLKTIE